MHGGSCFPLFKTLTWSSSRMSLNAVYLLPTLSSIGQKKQAVVLVKILVLLLRLINWTPNHAMENFNFAETKKKRTSFAKVKTVLNLFSIVKLFFTWVSWQMSKIKATLFICGPDSLILFHCNTPAYDTLFVRKFIDQTSVTKSEHLSYFVDVAVCYPWLSLMWRPPWRTIEFQTLTKFRDIRQRFLRAFQKWSSRNIAKRETPSHW